jgi:hypothetical protein
MSITFQKNGRGIKVFIGTTHMKTIPTKLLQPFKEQSNKINFDNKKRITAEERKMLHGYIFYAKWLEKLRKTEKHLWLLIKDHYPVGTRNVITKDNERFELVLDNNLKIKCPEKIYLAFTVEPNIIHSNY